MKKEMERTDKKQYITLLKHCLDETRGARKKDVRDKNKAMTIKDIINKYPAFKKENLILWEFGKLVFMDVCTIKDNWKQALDKVSLQFIDDEEHKQLSDDAKTIKF
ncbi:uncharacterized protein LOC122508915 [Leptopilina heterotoma]|uniref:uncharacterized protein LOC122508915 n=1 Tax=Leptopilina heterotoma TaxID=63436 RepID=UPI001CA9C024|nr:uncharacterized protein LOC122508915 [Leptopilina heterotoma]